MFCQPPYVTLSKIYCYYKHSKCRYNLQGQYYQIWQAQGCLRQAIKQHECTAQQQHAYADAHQAPEERCDLRGCSGRKTTPAQCRQDDNEVEEASTYPG